MFGLGTGFASGPLISLPVQWLLLSKRQLPPGCRLARSLRLPLGGRSADPRRPGILQDATLAQTASRRMTAVEAVEVVGVTVEAAEAVGEVVALTAPRRCATPALPTASTAHGP